MQRVASVPRRCASRLAHSSFFTRHPPPPRFRRALIWVVPATCGVALYLSSQPKKPPDVFASPALVPRRNTIVPTIFSPAEPDKHILRRILDILRARIWEPILTAKRFVRLFILFAPVIICTPMLLIGKPEKRLYGDRWGAVWWYGLLMSRMEAAGPTFIKLAQWAGSRTDLFPTLLCTRLGTLHSQGTPHDFRYTKEAIENVFQRRFEDVFEEFEESPIGTGAIAQVYRATLKQDLIPPSYLGPRRHHSSKHPAAAAILDNVNQLPPSVPSASVAIKVLHPHVNKTITRDLRIMSFFAHFIALFPGMQWLSLPEEVQVFGEMMFQQLDLRHEAENLKEFENHFAPRRVPISFPRPLTVWSTKELLVEEYEHALPLEAFLKNGGGPFDEQIATVGLDAFLNMLLLDNFVHSDLHPGNIMIKFAKPPSTQALLKNLWAGLFPHPSVNPSTGADLPSPPHSDDLSESDQIVTQLRSLTSTPVAWRAELQSLFEKGYIPEIVFIDAGLVTTLDDKNRANFLELFRAIAEFDGYRAGQLMVERCRTPELAIDTELFALKMQNIVLSVKRKTFSLGKIKISDILRDVLKSVREHHVKMEGDFVNTVISILLLEGIGRQLDPQLDLFKSALPILRRLGGQMAKRGDVTSAKDLQSSGLSAFLKVWVWLEAREFISASIVNADDMIKYDWLAPSI
ncbi:hypothetical protein EYR40_003745 [Pleurotus pulmonarius]|nr:hypothetical protein EYR40_003745 [Pleurotus pulmonarius]KAF4606455.1 hypothetical protein EYR38_000509 [Pleurotus pulmonarius]